MPEHAIFMATLAVGVLLFMGTISSIITTFLVFGLGNWIKGFSKEAVILSGRMQALEDKTHELSVAHSKTRTEIANLLTMMVDASNMELGPEEISKKIRTRLHGMGVLKKKGG